MRRGSEGGAGLRDAGEAAAVDAAAAPVPDAERCGGGGGTACREIPAADDEPNVLGRGGGRPRERFGTMLCGSSPSATVPSSAAAAPERCC